MKYSLTLFIALLLWVRCHAQDAPTAAPAIKTFALTPDISGAASNSVNLFTGDVALPLNLVSLPGKNGLDVNVSIAYSSNVQNIVDTWNLEAPTGILGLGWSMDVPKIVADHKQTGTREDDTYYIVEGGTSNRLVRTTSGSDEGGGYYVYETKKYNFWKIRYYYDISEIYGSTLYGDGPNKWEITKEDGTKYIYGDKNSGRNTLQYTVRWENWIGNSAQIEGQSQLVHAWNLSEIVNIWNDRITFEYDNVEQFVGSTSGQKQTEASYLKEITDANGKNVSFFYKEKDRQFYAEPHTEQPEPDAYQEFYERRYLDHINILNETGIELFSIQFAYRSVNPGATTAKMVLASIIQKNNTGNSLPGMHFDYFTSGNIIGFLKKITYPTGGTLSYQYQEGTIGHSNRQFTAVAPVGYAEAKTWIAEDYVVVAWRELSAGNHYTADKAVALYVYQWVGEWKEQFLQSITGVSLSGDQAAYYDYKDFQVVTQKDFFAVLSRASTTDFYHLFIKYKDQVNRGRWKDYSTTIDYGTGVPALLSGEHFVTVGSFRDDGTHPCHRYVFQGDTWAESELNQTIGDHYYTAANNYFISQNRANVDGFAEINFNYLTEDKQWGAKSWSASLLFASDGPSYWHSSNAMAVAMADNNPEFAYRWDLTYTNVTKDSKDINNNDLFGQLQDDYPFVYIIDNSLVGVLGRLARFDGKYWRTTTVTTSSHDPYFGDLFSYGPDLVVRPTVSSGSYYNGARREFDPNTLTWLPDYIMVGDEQGENFSSIGNGYYCFGKHYYFRQPSGTWTKIYSYPSISYLRRFSGYPAFDVVYGVYPYPLQEFRAVKNGEMTAPIGITGESFLLSNISFKTRGVGPHTLISYPSSFSAPEDATSLTLYRFVDGSIIGNQVDFPVSTITVNDGVNDRSTCFEYNFASATIDGTGGVAQYNEVSTIPGSNVPSVKPYGYTKSFFFNGLTAVELGVSTLSVDLRWNGLMYESQVFDASNLSSPVSTAKKTYSTFSQDLINAEEFKVDVGYYVRPIETISILDGIETKFKNEVYDANTGLVKRTSLQRGTGFTVQNHFTYWWEVYDNGTTPRSLNLLSPVIQTKKSYNGQTIEASATRWKSWVCTACNSGSSPGPFDSYSWLRNGSADFTGWNEGDPIDGGTWKFTSSVQINDKGQPVENTGISGINNSTLWHPSSPYVLADISNANLDEVLYEGFEDCTTDCSTDAKTGSKSSQVAYNVILPSPGSYTLTYWSKTTGDWALNVSTVSSNTAIGGSGILIDEVRLHPQNARMTTYSYDDFGNVTSICDENNEIIYREYDEFNRPRLIRDTDQNIVERHSYNFKAN